MSKHNLTADQLANQTEVIDVVDARAGDFRVRKMEARPFIDKDPFSWLDIKENMGMRRRSLREALIQQPDAGNLIRDGFRTIAYNEFMGLPVTYPQFVRTETSNKPEEYWLRDGTFGRIPRNVSGNPAPRLTRKLEGSAVIQNFNYAAIVEVLGDWIRYDRQNIIRQIAESLGRSNRVTEEAEVYDVITTTGNYTRTNTAGDNDVSTGSGANTQALDLTQANFEIGMTIIGTMKDRTSGMYLGLMPDTIIAGPLMKWPLMKLLNSGGITAAGTAGAVTQVGDLNVYRNAVSRIIISPYFTTSYDWLLADTKVRGVMFQQVEAFTVIQSTMTPDNTSWMQRDAIEYKSMGIFGTGFVDDRGWAYFTSTTRPTL